MPELMLSVLDILLILVAIAAAIWFGYLVWQNWLRNQPFFSRRPLNLAFFQSPKPVDRPVQDYFPKPASAERLNHPPETSHPQAPPPGNPQTGNQQVIEMLQTAINSLDRDELQRRLESARKRFPDRPLLAILEQVIRDLERER